MNKKILEMGGILYYNDTDSAFFSMKKGWKEDFPNWKEIIVWNQLLFGKQCLKYEKIIFLRPKAYMFTEIKIVNREWKEIITFKIKGVNTKIKRVIKYEDLENLLNNIESHLKLKDNLIISTQGTLKIIDFITKNIISEKNDRKRHFTEKNHRKRIPIVEKLIKKS